MDTNKCSTQLSFVLVNVRKPQTHRLGCHPGNYGTGGCKRGHDATLYVEQPSGIFVCLGCKRENNRLYKQRQRGTAPLKQVIVRLCGCGCGGATQSSDYLRGHRKRHRAQLAGPVDRRIGQRAWRAGLRKLVLAHYGAGGEAVCVGCGYADLRALSLDHLNGDGNAHRRRIKKWLYLWIKQQGFPEGYQTLCMNCQMIKAAEKQERPGGRKPRRRPQQEALAL